MDRLLEKIIANSFYELFMPPSNMFYLFDKNKAEQITKIGKDITDKLIKEYEN